MIQMPDHYAVLEVDPDAGLGVIHAAYRVLAQRDHPDRPTGSAKQMIALNQAWTVLRDTPSRASYDRERAAQAARACFQRTAERSIVGEPGPLARRRKATEPASPCSGTGGRRRDERAARQAILGVQKEPVTPS